MNSRFKYIHQLSFTGIPNSTQMFNSFKINEWNIVYQGHYPNLYLDHAKNIVNEEDIRTIVDLAANTTEKTVVFDLEYGEFSKTDNRLYSDAEVEHCIQKFRNVYKACKKINPDVKVGFYMLPVVKDIWPSYNQVLTPTAENKAKYDSWIAAVNRWNYTSKNGVLVEDSFTNYCDILCPEIYAYYGHDDHTYPYWASQHLEAAKTLFPGKAIYPYVMIYYHDSSSFVKKTLAPRTLQSIIDIIKGNLAEQDKTKITASGLPSQYSCDGMILWGGWRASCKVTDLYKTITSDVSSWNKLGRSSFNWSYSMGGPMYPVTCDFTNASSMEEVAEILQESINGVIDLVNDIQVPKGITREDFEQKLPWNGGYKYPYFHGPVSVVWDKVNERFDCTNFGGIGGRYENEFNVGSKMPFDIGGPEFFFHKNVVAGHNDMTSLLVPAKLYPPKYTPRNPDEFNSGWAENPRSPWWNTFVENSLADYSRWEESIPPVVPEEPPVLPPVVIPPEPSVPTPAKYKFRKTDFVNFHGKFIDYTRLFPKMKWFNY